MIGDISGLIFLRVTTGILSELVVFLGLRNLVSLKTSRAVIKNTTEIVLSETGKEMSYFV